MPNNGHRDTEPAQTSLCLCGKALHGYPVTRGRALYAPSIRLAFGLLLLGTTLTAQGSTRAAAQAIPQLPYTPSLDPMAMDRTADPCVDFYQFACGGWMKNNPLPPDQSSWTTYGKMQDENRALLRALLDQFAPGTRPSARTPDGQGAGL